MKNNFASENLENFLNFLTKVKSDYEYAMDQLKKCQDFTQDILHSLELDNLPYKEKCKLMTKLSTCRKDRRYWKDIVEELEPIYSVFYPADNLTNTKDNCARNVKTINFLRESLGKVRKVENYHSDRTYRPRIFKAE